MILCGILECKVDLSITFLFFDNHLAHVQRERDALERALIELLLSQVWVKDIWSLWWRALEPFGEI